MEPSEVLSRLRAKFPGLEWESLGADWQYCGYCCTFARVSLELRTFYGKNLPTVGNWLTDHYKECQSMDEAIAQLKQWIRDYANELLKTIGEEPK